MDELPGISLEEQNSIIAKAHSKKIDKISIDKLTAIICNLDAIVKEQRAKRLLVEAGSRKIIDDLNFYINKLYFREDQLKKSLKIIKKVHKAGLCLCKLIPKKSKIKRKAYNRYLNRLKKYEKILINYVPEGEKA